MTDKQKRILRSYLNDRDVDIQGVEFPTSLTMDKGATTERTLHGLVKIHYEYTLIGTDDTRGYVDWYDGHGDRKKTDFKGRVHENSREPHC